MMAGRMARTAQLCAWVALCLGAAQAADLRYTGQVSARNWDPLTPLSQNMEATTAEPAAYAALAGGNSARSASAAAKGGTVDATATSVVVHSPLGFDISGQAQAITSLHYRVQLVGPDVPLLVPVRVVAQGLLNTTGAASAGLSFAVLYDAGGSAALLADSATVYNSASRIFSFDQTAGFRPNAFFDVNLRVDASAGFSGATADGWAQAFLDPAFTIADPVAASLYHFAGVPAVTASVPEPANWALALLGLGVLGGALRGRMPMA
jgi:hypothetical protein